jgi:hypothetical protein
MFKEHYQPKGLESMPHSPALYFATIEFRRDQGMSQGVPSDIDFVAEDVKRVRIEALATDRYRRCRESSGVVGRLTAGLSSALRPLQTMVQQSPRSRRLPRQHHCRHWPTSWPNIRGFAALLTPETFVAAMILTLGCGTFVLLDQLMKVSQLPGVSMNRHDGFGRFHLQHLGSLSGMWCVECPLHIHECRRRP